VPGNAAELLLLFDKGRSTADLNHYQIELKWQNRQRAAIVPETLETPEYFEFEDGDLLIFE